MIKTLPTKNILPKTNLSSKKSKKKGGLFKKALLKELSIKVKDAKAAPNKDKQASRVTAISKKEHSNKKISITTDTKNTCNFIQSISIQTENRKDSKIKTIAKDKRDTQSVSGKSTKEKLAPLKNLNALEKHKGRIDIKITADKSRDKTDIKDKHIKYKSNKTRKTELHNTNTVKETSDNRHINTKIQSEEIKNNATIKNNSKNIKVEELKQNRVDSKNTSETKQMVAKERNFKTEKSETLKTMVDKHNTTQLAKNTNNITSKNSSSKNTVSKAEKTENNSVNTHQDNLYKTGSEQDIVSKRIEDRNLNIKSINRKTINVTDSKGSKTTQQNTHIKGNIIDYPSALHNKTKNNFGNIQTEKIVDVANVKIADKIQTVKEIKNKDRTKTTIKNITHSELSDKRIFKQNRAGVNFKIVQIHNTSGINIASQKSAAETIIAKMDSALNTIEKISGSENKKDDKNSSYQITAALGNSSMLSGKIDKIDKIYPLDKIIENINKIKNLKPPFNNTITIKLNPPKLGAIMLKVKMDKDKNISALIDTQDKDVFKTISAHADKLKNYLISQGIKIDNIDIQNNFSEHRSFGNSQNQSLGNFQNQSGNPQHNQTGRFYIPDRNINKNGNIFDNKQIIFGKKQTKALDIMV